MDGDLGGIGGGMTTPQMAAAMRIQQARGFSSGSSSSSRRGERVRGRESPPPACSPSLSSPYRLGAAIHWHMLLPLLPPSASPRASPQAREISEKKRRERQMQSNMVVSNPDARPGSALSRPGTAGGSGASSAMYRSVSMGQGAPSPTIQSSVPPTFGMGTLASALPPGGGGGSSSSAAADGYHDSAGSTATKAAALVRSE